MKKLLLILVIFPALAIAGNWEFNVFLFLEWWSRSPNYAEFVAEGSPCYGWIGGGRPDVPQPECWYDPSNSNPGWTDRVTIHLY